MKKSTLMRRGEDLPDEEEYFTRRKKISRTKKTTLRRTEELPDEEEYFEEEAEELPDREKRLTEMRKIAG